MGYPPLFSKLLCIKMPETGLEPALPLRQPGPQPGASAIPPLALAKTKVAEGRKARLTTPAVNLTYRQLHGQG